MTTTQQQQLVNINAVKPSPTNPRKRFDPKKLTELASSIREMGVLQDILVRPIEGSKFECVAGERRLRAAREAGLEAIPAKVRELTDHQVLEIQLTENIQRDDLTPLEEADAYKAIVDAGFLSAEEIAAKVGKSRSHVYGRLRLSQQLGNKARQALEHGRILPSVALVLTRIEGKDQDKALLEVEVKKGEDPWPVSEVTHRLRSFTQDLRRAPFDTKDALLVPEAGACVDCPKRTGNQRDLFGDVDGDDREGCTDSKCYQGKIDANWVQFKERAEAKGLKVLDPKKALNEYGTPKDGFVKAEDEPRHSHRLGKGAKTWKRLVGKELQPVVTQDPRTGAVVELYDAKAAQKALPAETKKALRGDDGSSSGGAKARKAKAGGVDETQVRELVHQRVAAELVEKAAAMSEQRVLEVLAVDGDRWGDLAQAADFCGWYAAGKTPARITKDIAGKNVQQLRALLLVQAYLTGTGTVEPTPPALKGLIDVKATEKSVRAELVAKAKADAKEASKANGNGGASPATGSAAKKAGTKKAKAKKAAKPKGKAKGNGHAAGDEDLELDGEDYALAEAGA